jgi:hypothetical protein
MMTCSFFQLACLLLLARFALLQTGSHMHESCFLVRSFSHFNYERAKRTL